MRNEVASVDRKFLKKCQAPQIPTEFIALRCGGRWSRCVEIVALHDCIAYDPATMARSRSRAAFRTVLRIACDLMRLVASRCTKFEVNPAKFLQVNSLLPAKRRPLGPE